MFKPLALILSTIAITPLTAQEVHVVVGQVSHKDAYMYMYSSEINPYNVGLFLISDDKQDTVLANPTPITGHEYTSGAWSETYSAEGLTPGVTYNIYAHTSLGGYSDELTSFTTLVDWPFHMDAPDFSFVTGSCSYINDEPNDRPGTPYGGHYEIYEAMADEEAAFNLWLGDNVYLRNSDASSASAIFNRYEYDRNTTKLQMLLESRPNIAIWDDHDAGPNDCVGTYPLMPVTREAFAHHWPRAVYGTSSSDDMRWVQTFSDVVFIGLDNRSHRTSQYSSTPQILGKDQIDWLVSQVHYYHNASFIVVAIGGQVLNSESVYENYANYPVEHQYLLEQLFATGYDNIVFLSGDRHHSEISEIHSVNQTDFRMVDFTVSPMTSGPSTVADKEMNENRVGDAILERNYAVIEVSGDKDEREMTITYKDVDGKKISSHTIESL